MLKEEFLHHIWKYGLFNQRELTTTDGKPVQVINAGQHNHHSGPDFFNAQVIIADTTWAGNVEIHVHEKDWERHGHQHDQAYRNVVLHVVYYANERSENDLGTDIPVLELAGRISRKQLDLYTSFLESKQYIPCEKRIREVDELLVSNWLERLLIERLERKSQEVLNRLKRNTGDWQQTLFEQLALNFGFKTNSPPMEMLARSIPVQLISKYQHSLFMLEALLFGQAGLLDTQYRDDHPRKLQNEYVFLRQKHRLIPLNAMSWKFGRMRPPNFPTVRIAQFAVLLHQSKGLFRSIVNQPDENKLLEVFNVSASGYWSGHHHFDKPSLKKTDKKLGTSSRENILINTVVPFLFAYSKHLDSPDHLEKALQITELLPAENNSVIKKLGEIQLIAGNAGRSQALLELKAQYCDKKKCLNCAVGNQLLKTVSND